MNKIAITEEQGIHKNFYKQAKELRSIGQLAEFLEEITTKYHHDYGTIVHAIAAAAVGAANVVNRSEVGGITGFQASCVEWSFIRHYGVHSEDELLTMIDLGRLLYPQYDDRMPRTISRDTFEEIMKRAKEKLAEEEGKPAEDPCKAHPTVRARWELIASGSVPSGMAIREN